MLGRIVSILLVAAFNFGGLPVLTAAQMDAPLPDLPEPITPPAPSNTNTTSPIANLVPSLMDPLVTSSGLVVIEGEVTNLENLSGEARAALFLIEGDATVELQSFVVPVLSAGESTTLRFEWAPPPGISHLRLVADVHNSVFESDEADNVASSWVAVEAQPGTVILVDGAATAEPTWGSTDTLLFQDRPMIVAAARSSEGLTFDFTDGDPTGQTIWFNAAWLEGFHIERPVFTYDDGAHIPFEQRGDYYVVRAPHFSIIHAADADASIFSLVNGGDAVLQWNIALDRVDITSAASDATDESLVTGFVSHRAYKLKVNFGVDQQGDGQEIYPLALGSKAERAAPSPDPYALSSFGYRYLSWESGQTYPTIEAYYRRASDEPVVVWTWSTVENPTILNPYEDWSVVLQLRRAADQFYFELLDIAGNVQRSVVVPSAALPSVDSVFFANHGAGAPSAEPTLAWAGSFALDPLEGDLVLEGIEWNTWTDDGQASIYVDGTKHGALLTGQGYPGPGRVWLNGCPSFSSFSVQFTYEVQTRSMIEPFLPGFVFFFSKNIAYAQADGATLGFEDAAGGISGHQGFGVVFDGRRDASTGDPADGYVAIVQDTVSNRLASTLDPRVNDQRPHIVNIERHEEHVYVYLDGLLALHAQLPSAGVYNCIGFSSSLSTIQEVDVYDFLLSTIPPNEPPLVPSSPNPPSGAQDPPRTTTLTWIGGDPQGTTTDYNVNIDTVNPPRPWQQSGLYCTEGGFESTLTSCKVEDLVGGQTYYWQVTASDGVYDAAGAVWSFVPTVNRPPNIPSSPQPANGATNVPIAPALAWAGGDPDAEDTVTYQVYLGTTNPPTTLACSNLQTPSCSAAGLDYGRWYYWRVEARDANNALTIGPIWKFRTLTSGNHAPLVPSNPWPSDGVSNMRSGFVATWTGGDQDGDVPLYDVYVSPWTSSLSGTPFCQKVAVRSCTIGALLPSMTYRWKVVASDGQLSRTGPEWGFTTRPNLYPPGSPKSPFPVSGSSQQSLQPVLRWSSGGDGDGDMPRYDVFILGAGGTNKACSTYGYECALPRLSPNMSYAWWVIAFDGVHAITSPVWSFTTRANALPVLVDSWPGNGANGVSPDPTLTWSAFDPDGTDPTYVVRLGSQPTTSSSPVVCNSGSLNQCQLQDLETTTTYYWRVDASDEFGKTTGPWWSFTTAQPSGNVAPTVSSPDVRSGNHNGTSATWLLWTGEDDNDDELEYDVYLDEGEHSPSTKVCTNVKDPNCMVYGLRSGRIYTWVVEAKDELTSKRGPEWLFEILPCSTGLDSLVVNTILFDNGGVDLAEGDGSPEEPFACPDPSLMFATDPYEPSRPSPATGKASVDPVDANLTWMMPNPNGGRTYDVYLDIVNPPNRRVCVDLPIGECQVGDILDFGATYFWYVMVKHGERVKPGPVWSFSTSSCSFDWCPTLEEKLQISYGNHVPDASPDEVFEGSETLDVPLAPGNPEGSVASVANLDLIEETCPAKTSRNTACTMIVLHGISNAAYSDSPEHYGVEPFIDAKEFFETRGYEVVLPGYYGGECARTNDTTSHGSHSWWMTRSGHGGHSDREGCDPNLENLRHDLRTDWRHMANHLAWWIYDEYTINGKPVDIAAHSMGGLMTRYALAMIDEPMDDEANEQWPPRLLVESVLTWGTPHRGTWIACADYMGAAAYAYTPYQTKQLCTHSSTTKDLQKYQYPRGGMDPAVWQTSWLAVGSTRDHAVYPHDNHNPSATDMAGATKFHFRVCPEGSFTAYGHSEYYGDVSSDRDACGDYTYRNADGKAVKTTLDDAPRGVTLAFEALKERKW